MIQEPADIPNQSPETAAPRIVLFLPSFGDGGVGRIFVHFANGFSALGMATDLMVKEDNHPYVDRLSSEVNRVLCRGRDDRALAVELAEHVEKFRPSLVLSCQERDNHVALDAKKRLGRSVPETRFVLLIATSLGARTRLRHRFWWPRWRFQRKLRGLLGQADAVITNSEGTAADLAQFSGIQRERLVVLPSPTIPADILELAARPVDHPWFETEQPPVILGIGRLGRAKDFPTLLSAFARVRHNLPCRLMILGRGRQRDRLLEMARKLGVEEDFALPGYVVNPYAFLAKSSLFVLSSQWEGCPNALIEALAIGTPAVSTDCPSGPREILGGGRYGRLTPPGDIEALADAMLHTLRNPLPAEWLRQAARKHTIENSCRNFLRAFALLPA